MAFEGDNQITGILNKAGAHLTATLKDEIQRTPFTPFGVVNASGKLKDSIRYDIKGGVLRVYGLGYIYWLSEGRKPGGRPPSNVIEQWIKDKGLIVEGITVKSLAFLIARKIGEKGTIIHQQGGTPILTDTFNAEFVGQVKSEIVLTMKKYLINETKQALLGKYKPV